MELLETELENNKLEMSENRIFNMRNGSLEKVKNDFGFSNANQEKKRQHW